MKFIIRELKFEIKEVDDQEFEAWVTFQDGDKMNITEVLGVGPAGTESGCCYQILLWMEKNGI